MTLWRPAAALRRGCALAGFALLLGGCASSPPPAGVAGGQPPWQAPPRTDVLLFGEQHDAADHHRIEHFLVRTLAAEGRLAAVAIEMAERGRSTRGLPSAATEEQVRDALAWPEAGWPWERYGPAVMAAVRAGIVVAGANLPRSAMREAMANVRWDAHLPPDALAQQQESIRTGHCDLLPTSQIAPMTRIQIARDDAMARTAQELLQPGKTVLLIAGGGHVLRELGVPTHLPPSVSRSIVLAVAGTAPASAAAQADAIWPTPALPPQDYCATLRPRPSGPHG